MLPKIKGTYVNRGFASLSCLKLFPNNSSRCRKVLATAFFRMMCNITRRYLSICVFFPYTVCCSSPDSGFLTENNKNCLQFYFYVLGYYKSAWIASHSNTFKNMLYITGNRGNFSFASLLIAEAVGSMKQQFFVH